MNEKPTPTDGEKSVAVKTSTWDLEPGRRFGMWTVLSLVPGTSGKHRRYVCRCACGKKKSVLAASLMGNKSKSCGCWIKSAHNRIMGNWFHGSSQRREEFAKRKSA